MNLEVTLAGKTFKNPVTTASGTFGSGAEYEQFVDLAALGAVTTKGVANVPWEGNPTPRGRNLWWNAECCRTSESGNRFIL